MRTAGTYIVGGVALVLVVMAFVFKQPAALQESSTGGTVDSRAGSETAKPTTSQIEPVNSEPSTTSPPGSTTQPAARWQPPVPPGAAERVGERKRMVQRQIARRGIRNAAVLQAMRTSPRHVFVTANRQRFAYDDTPLPIGHGQTISQPYIVALMTELLELTPKAKVLEIGTGSGYQAAVLAHLTPHVFTVEIIKPLAKQAEKRLHDQGYKQIQCLNADGYHGWREQAPFDVIIVTCAAGHLPPPLWQQLKPGGRIVIPIGAPYEVQRLVVLTKTLDSKRRSRSVTAVRFVPMTGKVMGK